MAKVKSKNIDLEKFKKKVERVINNEIKSQRSGINFIKNSFFENHKRLCAVVSMNKILEKLKLKNTNPPNIISKP